LIKLSARDKIFNLYTDAGRVSMRPRRQPSIDHDTILKSFASSL